MFQGATRKARNPDSHRSASLEAAILNTKLGQLHDSTTKALGTV